MIGEKDNPQDELVIEFFEIQEHIIICQSVEKLRSECKVIHRAHQEMPCFIVQCMERTTQHNALIRTVNELVKDVTVLRHGDVFETRCNTNSDRGIQGRLEQTCTHEHIAALGSRPQLLDVCEVRFLNRVIRWVVPPFGKAPDGIEIEADPKHSELLIKNSVR